VLWLTAGPDGVALWTALLSLNGACEPSATMWALHAAGRPPEAFAAAPPESASG
jgi:hypothetical protein